MAASLQLPVLEIAHVLFMDIVGYSKLPMDKQQQQLALLQKVVRESQQFTCAETQHQLIRLPTGDGMALVFFGNAEAPLCCAIEIDEKLRQFPESKLRMGIHTGPVYRVDDINAAQN